MFAEFDLSFPASRVRRLAIVSWFSVWTILAAASVFAGQRTTAADLVGTWRGERVALDGTSEPVTLDLELDADGALVGTVSFPDRNDASSVRLDPMTVRLELLDGRSTSSEDFFEAFVEDRRTTLRGFWYYQGSDDRPMNLDRVGVDGELVAKPPPRQRPRPPVETGPAPRPAGRWQGRIERPDEESIELVIDIDRVTTVDGPMVSVDWVAELDMDYQAVTSYPLGEVVIGGEGAGASVRFVAEGLPDRPVFVGQVGTAGDVIEGVFAAGSASFHVRLERIGDPELEPRPKLGPLPRSIAETWVGRWEGALSSFGIRDESIALNLDMVDRNALVGTLDLAARGNFGMPIVQIVAWTFDFRAELPHSDIEIEGHLSEDGQVLRATVSFHGTSQPVELRKVDAGDAPSQTD